MNVISDGFTAGGETSGAREVYVSQILGTILAGKHPREEKEVIISFSESEMVHVTRSHEDALAITAEIDDYDIKRVLIDSGGSTDKIYLDTLKKMGRSEKDLQKVNYPLMGFASQMTYAVGAITLLVYLGEGWKALTLNVTFIVVDAPISYNAILGCSTLNPKRIVHSTYHQMMKFSTPHGIGVVKGDQPMVRTCYIHSVRRHVLKGKESLAIQTEEDPREERSHPDSGSVEKGGDIQS